MYKSIGNQLKKLHTLWTANCTCTYCLKFIKSKHVRAWAWKNDHCLISYVHKSINVSSSNKPNVTHTHTNTYCSTHTYKLHPHASSQKYLHILTHKLHIRTCMYAYMHITNRRHMTLTCSAMNLNPWSSRMHSYVSPRMGLKGFFPARWKDVA